MQAGSSDRVERRLAAILAADVVGYSRLMGQDETGTLDRMRELRRELIDPTVAEHKGRLVKTTGDGVLMSSLRLSKRSPVPLRCNVGWSSAMPVSRKSAASNSASASTRVMSLSRLGTSMATG